MQQQIPYKGVSIQSERTIQTALVKKLDRDFCSYAIPFEIRFSTLAYRGLFVPVVKEKGLARLGIKIRSRIVKSLVRRTTSREARLALAANQGNCGRGDHAFIEKGCGWNFRAEDRHDTNPTGTRLIEAGGRPLHFKFLTSPRSGVVMVETANDVRTAYKHGYFVVDADGVARSRVCKAHKSRQGIETALS